MLCGNLYLYIPDNCKLKGYIVLSKYGYSKTMGESRCKGEELKVTEPCEKLIQTAEPNI